MSALRHVVSFVLHRKTREPEAPSYLECRVKWNASREVVALSVGFVVDPAKWDAAQGLCVAKSYHGSRRIPAAVINREIGRFTAAADDLMSGYADRDEWPTAREVRADLRKALGIDASVESVPVERALLEYRTEGPKSLGWSLGTIKKYRSLQNHIAEWDEALTFDAICQDKLTDFVRYMQEDLGMRNSTVSRNVGLFKAFLGWSCRRGYLKENGWEDYRVNLKQAPQQIIYLTWDELMSLWNWEPDSEAHGRVRDFFCFCAFSGLRYSDACNLRWSDVTDTEIVLTSIKDVDGLRIDLNDFTQEILGRYVDAGFPGDRVLPSLTNQVMNRELKLIMRAVGLTGKVHRVYYRNGERVDEIKEKWEVMGTHAARRTFISNALMMGIPATTVMRWTGHSDYQAMKPYIAIADADRKAQMRKFSERKTADVTESVTDE